MFHYNSEFPQLTEKRNLFPTMKEQNNPSLIVYIRLTIHKRAVKRPTIICVIKKKRSASIFWINIERRRRVENFYDHIYSEIKMETSFRGHVDLI